MRALIALLLVTAFAHASARQSSPAFPLVVTLEGELTHADYERQFERTFTVPPGTQRIDISLTSTGRERRTVVDLGLRSPSGVRGWSGGRDTRVHVGALTASRGYLPGPIEAGAWAVVLGVPNIRPDSQDRYTLTITLSDRPFGERPVLRDGPGWYAGDLHAHSGHSDGRSASQSGAAVPGSVDRVFEAAVRAGLDFITLSDHNTAAHWLDVDRLQPNYDRLLLLHGREITTYRGHANTVNETAFLDFRLNEPSRSPGVVLAPIAATGAFISINHPTRPDDETCMGCGWNLADPDVLASVHGIEVVNGNKRSGALFGWPYWAQRLNEGHRLTAVGGSDDHTPDVMDDYNIGSPTTVVWAASLSEGALSEGLKSGRVYIRTRGPYGPALDYHADGPAGPVPMGGISRPGRMRLTAHVTGAEGLALEWIRRGVVLGRTTIGTAPITREVDAVAGDWFSLIAREGDDPVLISNPIYVR